jgi:2,5-diketo-D-gluconate reductase B
VPRERIFVTTKLANGNLAAADVARSTEESLRQLGTEHIDLLLIHWPSKIVPMSETLDAMKRLQEAGKTRFIGVSNFTVKLLDEAIEKHGADLLCNQVEYHPFLSQRAVLAAVRRHGMMLGAYSPVARGKVDQEPLLQRLGRKYAKTPAQISLRWLIDQEGVAPLPKAGSRAHAAANIDIFDFELEAEDRAAIDQLGGNGRITDIAGWAPDWDKA